jgi:hypothetical protein
MSQAGSDSRKGQREEGGKKPFSFLYVSAALREELLRKKPLAQHHKRKQEEKPFVQGGGIYFVASR